MKSFRKSIAKDGVVFVATIGSPCAPENERLITCVDGSVGQGAINVIGRTRLESNRGGNTILVHKGYQARA